MLMTVLNSTGYLASAVLVQRVLGPVAASREGQAGRKPGEGPGIEPEAAGRLPEAVALSRMTLPGAPATKGE